MTKVVAIESKIESKIQQNPDSGDADTGDMVSGIALQEASLDIWEKKYRLKSREGEHVDVDLDDTYKRVARALADVEESEEKKSLWYEKFLWVLRHKSRLWYWLRLFNTASQRRVRIWCRRLHIRPSVLHGYLRQDVLHRLVRWWQTGCANGDI